MPTRYLRPGVRDSEAIDAVSPLAETLFYRLLVTVDDFGRYDGRPSMIKAHCFPIKEMAVAKCAALLEELHTAGLVILYTLDGKPYLQLCKWDNVPRAKESKYPAPEHECAQLHTSARKTHTDAPLTVTVTETKTETVNRKPDAPRTRSADSAYTPDFESAWSEYPDRPGNAKAAAFKAWSARIKEGVKPEAMIDGVKRYAAHCLNARTEPQFIKQASTFFGPDRHFESDWTFRLSVVRPPNRQEAVEQRNQAAMEAWLAQGS